MTTANRPPEGVSWSRAWRRGLEISLHHRTLLLLVGIAVVCERAVSLSASFNPRIGDDWISQIQRLGAATVDSTVPEIGDVVQAVPWTLLLAAVLILAGMLLLVGVVTLVRDLLLKGGYRAPQALAYGGRYFWRVLLYKLPIYLAGSLFSLIVAGALIDLWQVGSNRWGLPVMVVVAGWLAGFAVARVFLSLGTKVIVTESRQGTLGVYQRVWRIVRADLSAVAIFYLLLLGLTALTLAAVWGLSRLAGPLPLRLAIAVSLMAAATLTMKAAAFDLYLQLARRVDGAPPQVV